MSKPSKETFIYDLLLAYGQPKTAITRLKSLAQGTYNLSKVDGEVLWKKKIFFKSVKKGDLHDIIDEAKNAPTIKKQDPRFLIVTDYKTLLAIDTKSTTSLDIEFERLSKHFDFFLPLAGFEKVSTQVDNPADIKAAEKMAKLYDQIKLDNPGMSEMRIHELNVFLSRLLFCYFAEDTEIFEKGAFTSSIASHTNPDGSDLATYLDRLFAILNTKERKNLPAYLQKFPYVNGGLLAAKIDSPVFTFKSRKILIECGELNWSEINPDIFGSMIQAVVNPDQRSGMGMHYTSVQNIMKVIEPLFLNEIKEEFEGSLNEPKRLIRLLERISNIKIFDPACGSGNFLIISFKELRKIELNILRRLSEINRHAATLDSEQLALIPKAQISFAEKFQFSLFSRVELKNFYGIEIDDFAHEIAILSLWLAEHQMNMKFKENFGASTPTLPLKQGGNIVCDNAVRVNWEEVCKVEKNEEVFIIGNPPYLGSKNQDMSHKKDIQKVLGDSNTSGVLDYISCWIVLGSKFIRGKMAKFAFVSTNSICQGEQVALLWPKVLLNDLEIDFAHQSFKWTNNAKNKAGVVCVIVGVRNKSNTCKYLFSDNIKRKVNNINGYLIDGSDVFIENASRPLNGLPRMSIGNKPIDDGNYLFTKGEKDEFLKLEPNARQYFYRWYGSVEFLNGIERWCLLPQRIPNENLQNLPLVTERINKVREFRNKSKSEPTREIARTPERFHVECFPENNYIVVPKVSSERRIYLPVGFFSNDMIASDLLNVIWSSELYIFGLISSKMHFAWVKALTGRLGSSFRYSSKVLYNTFPVPEISPKTKGEIESNVLNILSEREKFPEISIGDLYDPDLIPISLKKAHELLDTCIDKLYRSKPFLSDEERLEHLFAMYNKMMKSEKEVR